MHKQFLKNAWQSIKINKSLWFLGFLSLAFLNGSEFSLVYKFYQINNGLADLISEGTLLGGINNYNSEFSFLNFVIVVVLAVIIFVIPILAQASLLSGLVLRKSKHAGFKDIFKAGWRVLGRFLAINIVSNAFIYILTLIALSLTRLFFVNTTNEIMGLILSISVIVTPIAIIVSFITRYASLYLIDDYQKNIFEAYRLGARTFFKNWFESFKTTIILFIVLTVMLLLSSAVMSLVIYPTILIVGWFKISSLLATEIIGISILFYALATFILSMAIFGVFYYAYWLSVFEKIRQK